MSPMLMYDVINHEVLRVLETAGKLYILTEGRVARLLDPAGIYLYLGKPADIIKSSTVMRLLESLYDLPDENLIETIELMKQDMAAYNLRCDVDDIQEPTFELTERDMNVYKLTIWDSKKKKEILVVSGACDTFCKEVANAVIDYCIACGIDLRVKWDVHNMMRLSK